MISMRVSSAFGQLRETRQRPIVGRRWTRAATVSATVTASTVTWCSRTTRHRLLLDAAQVRQRQLRVVTPASRSGG